MIRMNTMDSESRYPLYLKLYDILYDKIKTGEYPAGSYLPTENELAKMYSVSRITIRNALDLLVEKGLIAKKKGSGSYVKPQLIDQPVNTVVFFEQDMARFGHRPTTHLLRNTLVYADSHIAECLGIPENTKMICVVRLRFANDEPLCLEMSYLIYDRCPGVLNKDFSNASLRDYLKSEYDIVWHSATQQIYAITASPEIAPLLNLKRGDPVLYIERMSSCKEGPPMEFLMAYYRGDRYYLTAALDYK